jgi:hypothetical protein
MSGLDARPMGGGRGEVLDKIGRGAHLSRHPSPKLGFLFSGFFLKAREARSKKKKEADSKTANLVLDKK